MRGTGRARAGDTWTEIGAGDTLVLPPGAEHVVENARAGKLYCLTLMVPDEVLTELIRGGVPAMWDDEDRRVVEGK